MGPEVRGKESDEGMLEGNGSHEASESQGPRSCRENPLPSATRVPGTRN